MAFHDVTLPEPIAIGSLFSLGFKTEILQRRDGSEYRYDKWSRARYKADLASGIKKPSQLRTLQDFYFARQGSQNSFRVRMPVDFTTAPNGRNGCHYLDQFLGEGDGTSPDTFQLMKKYFDAGGYEYRRVIDKPIYTAGPPYNQTMWVVRITPTGIFPTYKVLVEDDAGQYGYSVDYGTGELTVVTGLADAQFLMCGCEFDICMRFDAEIDEAFMLSLDEFDIEDLPNIPLIEEPSTNPVWEQVNQGGVVNHGDVSESFYVCPSEGRVHVFNPTAAITIYVPDSSKVLETETHHYPAGGPALVFFNESTSYDVNVYDEYGNLVTVAMRWLNPEGSAAIADVYLTTQFATGDYNVWGGIKRT